MRHKTLIFLMLTLTSLSTAREIAIVSPQEYSYISAFEWNLTAPTFSPDSTMVMFDMQGNVEFPPDLLDTLEIMQVELITDRDIMNWLITNNWIEEE